MSLVVGSGITVESGVTISSDNLILNLDAATYTSKTTWAQQNVSGTSTNVGFFPYGWQTNPNNFNEIQVGWTCVQLAGSVVTAVGNGTTDLTVTISGATFISGDTYTFTSANVWFDTVANKPFYLYNNPVYSSTIGGGTFEFVPASGQYATTPTSLNEDLNHWSVIVWHYYTGTNYGSSPCIITEVYPGSTGQINYALGSLNDNNPTLMAGWYSGGWYMTGYTLTPNNWYQIAGTYDGSSVKLYVNNVQVGGFAATGNAISSQGGINLMRRWDNAEFWGGYLSIVKIYAGNIGSGGVADDWNANLPRFISLVYNLDAANYSALPVDGSTVAGSGSYPITVSNSYSSLSWSSSNGGVFNFNGTNGLDTMYGGPNYVTGQSYTVFMVYQLDPTVDGRLLNTQDESSKDWLMGSYSGNMNVFYPNGVVNLNSDPEDTLALPCPISTLPQIQNPLGCIKQKPMVRLEDSIN